MGMLTTLKDAISRLLGHGQGDEDELILPTFLEDGGPDTERPSRQEAVNRLAGYRQQGNGQDVSGGLEGESPGVESRSDGGGVEHAGESQEAEGQSSSDMPAPSDDDREDEDTRELDLGSEGQDQEGSSGFGDLSLDIFDSEHAVDEGERDLPEGLVDIDVQDLLDECGDIAGKLVALSSHQVTLPSKPESQA